ncbi:MAG TPA: class I adenylate-forming enzyme family protein [Terriglobales bacterium]|nr:class I adenylate-forming enzyme family protein [Terriglobales bacterium]
MSKGAVGLTAGYWPEDIYRYLAIPGISLDDGLIARPGKRTPNRPALIGDQGSVTYKQLIAEADQLMKSVLACLEGKGNRVAMAIAAPLPLARALFGALKGRCVVFPVNLSTTPGALANQLQQFRPDLVIADDAWRRTIGAGVDGVRIISFLELEETKSNVGPPRGRQDLGAPVLALAMEGGGLAYHSHKSLLAGAVSWSTFVPLKTEDLVLAAEPLYTWEGLYGLLPILFRGGTCLLGDLQNPEGLARGVVEHRPIYTILSRPGARLLYQSSHRVLVQAFRECLRGLFVSTTGPFTAIGRMRLKNLLGKPALLAFGSAEAGPVFSSHPTWFLDSAVGIPVTNVDVWPLNPASGNPLEVPWETIEYGEVGVKSPMTAVDYQSPEEKDRRVKGGWLRTKIVTTMDPNGLFYIQSKIAD